jgi:aminopeptidase N
VSLRSRGARVAAVTLTALLSLPGFRPGSASAKAGRSAASSTEGGDYDVLDYDDEIDIDRTRMLVRGHERIRLRSSEPDLRVVVFPRNGIDVISLRADQGGTLGRHAAEVIEVRFPRPLKQNQIATIAVEYQVARPKGVEFHRDAIYTSFNSCSWMVCREHPGDKATLRLSIGGVADLSVVASGEPVARASPGGEGDPRSVWRESTSFSSYLFAFALGKFTRYSERHGGVELEIYAGAGDGDSGLIGQMFKQSEAALDFFLTKWGQPFPHGRYRQVVVDGDAAQEASSFSIVGRAELTSLSSSPQRNWIIAHEMAHQFWGNSITCARWADFWLNEGMAVFMAAAFDEHRWGREAYERDLKDARARYQVAVDAGFDVPMTFDGDFPSLRIKRAVVYSKAALFLDVLRTAMGEQAFWAALKNYSRVYAGGLATTGDFERLFESESRADVSQLFRSWVYGPESGTRLGPGKRL